MLAEKGVLGGFGALIRELWKSNLCIEIIYGASPKGTFFSDGFDMDNHDFRNAQAGEP